MSIRLPCCESCEGNNVRLEAYAEYDPETQAWVLGDIYDQSWCADCKDDCVWNFRDYEGDPR
jgi:hypothetical protein